MSLVDAIPIGIREVGRARAQGAQAGGAYGVALADIGQMVGQIPAMEAAKRSRGMQEQIQSLQLAKAKREAAADQALQSASQFMLNPDGSYSDQFIQHLQGTPAASQIPTIMEHMNRAQQSALELQTGRIRAQQGEDDILGSIGAGASAAQDPGDKAGIITTALAAAQKRGTISADRAKQELSNLLDADGQPDPTKLDETIQRWTKGSKTQRELAEREANQKSLDAQRKASEEATKTLQEQRDIANEQAQLRNVASQLGSATTQADYARRYAGVPEKLKAYFADPAQWTPEASKAAADVALTPAEREARAKDLQAAENAKDTARYRETMAKIAAQNANSNAVRAGVDAAREKREASKPAAGTKEDEKDYKEFVSQYQHAQTEQRERAPMAPANPADPLSPLVKQTGPYVPPPSMEKWQAMTPTERAAVMRDPNARINDAELARRLGGGAPTPAQAAAPAGGPAPYQVTPAAPKLAVGQVVSVRGKKIKITAVHADGTFDGTEAK